jgi:hypothetical protein
MALIKVDGIKFKGSYKLKGGLIFVNWKEALDLRYFPMNQKVGNGLNARTLQTLTSFP